MTCSISPESRMDTGRLSGLVPVASGSAPGPNPLPVPPAPQTPQCRPRPPDPAHLGAIVIAAVVVSIIVSAIATVVVSAIPTIVVPAIVVSAVPAVVVAAISAVVLSAIAAVATIVVSADPAVSTIVVPTVVVAAVSAIAAIVVSAVVVSAVVVAVVIVAVTAALLTGPLVVIPPPAAGLPLVAVFPLHDGAVAAAPLRPAHPAGQSGPSLEREAPAATPTTACLLPVSPRPPAATHRLSEPMPPPRIRRHPARHDPIPHAKDTRAAPLAALPQNGA